MAYIDTKYFGKCKTCRHHSDSGCDVWCENGEFYSPSMSKIPTADVQEVKHGEWIVAEECKMPLSHGYIRTEKTYVCPFCTHHFRKKMKFCGECGAKMDGGKEE